MKIFFISLFSVLFCLSSWASDPKDQDPDYDPSIEHKLIETNIAISSWFDSVAEGLDLFLAGKRLTKRRNETSVKFENISTVRERENGENTTSVNADLRLPNVEEYWQVKFTSYDETKEKRAIQRANVRRENREQNYGASVGLFKKLGAVRTSFQPRIGLQDPLKISQALTFESVANLEPYQVNPKLQFFANPDDGTGVFMALNFQYAINKTWALTFINDSEYFEKNHLDNVTNGVSLGQAIDKLSSFSYNLFFDSNNQTSYHLEGITVSVGYSHLVYKNIFQYQLTPFVDLAKATAFRAVPGIALNLMLQF